MRQQSQPRALRVLVAFVALAGCSKAATTELRATEAPVARSRTTVADAAEPADAPNDARASDAFGNFGRDNASGAQLGPEIDTGVATRNPARDLSKQIGGDQGARAVPSSRIPTRVMLESHRALDSTTLQSSKVAARYMGTGEAAVKRCYEALLANEPGTAGMLTMRFAVTPAGRVVDATADSWSQTLSKCVREVMSTWTFPAPAKQARFELVLSLEAE